MCDQTFSPWSCGVAGSSVSHGKGSLGFQLITRSSGDLEVFAAGFGTFCGLKSSSSHQNLRMRSRSSVVRRSDMVLFCRILWPLTAHSRHVTVVYRSCPGVPSGILHELEHLFGEVECEVLV